MSHLLAYLIHLYRSAWVLKETYPWWRDQMETNFALLAICAGRSPDTGEFPAQRLMTRSFDVFFDLRPNKRLSKQSWSWWFEMSSRPYDVTVMLNRSSTSGCRGIFETRAPSKYPKRRLSYDLVKSRSHEIGTLNCRIALKFDRHISNNAAEVPVKFQSDRTILHCLQMNTSTY